MTDAEERGLAALAKFATQLDIDMTPVPTVRMIMEVSSTSGEMIFYRTKKYPVLETLPGGSVVSMSERGRKEAMHPGEFVYVTAEVK